jgi:hypothetical protein
VEDPRADTHAPDFSVRVVREEALRCSEGVVSYDIRATVNVDGYDFPPVGRLHLCTDISLVYFIPTPSGFFSGIAGLSGGHKISPDGNAGLLSDHVRLYYTRDYHA